MRQTPERFAVITVDARCRVTTRYSRRHIDLQRVATALCPA
ncbi:putative leader peptide [Kitasatospora nipponensis]